MKAKITVYYISFLLETPWPIDKKMLCQEKLRKQLIFDLEYLHEKAEYNKLIGILNNTVGSGKYDVNHRLLLVLPGGKEVYVNGDGYVLHGRKSYVLEPRYFLWLYLYLEDKYPETGK